MRPPWIVSRPHDLAAPPAQKGPARRAGLACGLACVMFLGVVWLARAQTGIPGEIAGYRSWTKMNGILLNDPSNPQAGPKNTFVNLSPEQLADIYGGAGRARHHFPDGAVVVRETLDAASGFIRVLFVMRYDSKATATKAWVFSGYTRTAADKPFEAAAIPDPVARCLNCHAQVKGADYVFTPYTNRAMPPVPTPAQPGHVDAFNYQFGPQILRVKAGTAVTWTNEDVVPHDVKAADKSFESGNIPPFGIYTVTLDKPGTWQYFCAVHLGMRGTIVVEP